VKTFSNEILAITYQGGFTSRQLTPPFTPAEREDYATRLPGTRLMPSSPAGRPFKTPSETLN